MIKKKKSILSFISKYQYKIGIVAFGSALIGLLLNMTVSYFAMNSLFNHSSEEVQKGINNVVQEYMSNYISITEEMIEFKLQRFFDEQAVVTDLYQKYLDNYDELGDVTSKIVELPMLKDNLTYSGRWYQNSSDEQAVVLVQRYLLDENNNILPNAKKQIDQSIILDWLMPSIYNNGAKKLWVYFQGGRDASFMRISPWNDAGTALDSVYPGHTDEEIWDAFNPGLVDGWEEKMNKQVDKSNLRDFAIMKAPVQDGGSGKITMTLDQPIWSKDRKTFKGAICVDVELDEIISYIEDLKLGSTGFAYISQSNGNVFAINNKGINTLGLKEVEDATIKDNDGVGFNAMQRFFSESTFDSVKQIQVHKGESILIEEFDVTGKEYILVQKNLKPFNTWNKDRGFYEENWTMGFVVPKKEMFSSYIQVTEAVSDSKTQIIIEQFIIALLTLLLLALGIHAISKAMTNNLTMLERAAIKIMNKDYDVNIKIKSKDEFGRLGTTINNMAMEIRNTIQKLRVQNEQLQIEISEKIKREKMIKYLEDHDVLTNLPNQGLIARRVDELLHEKDSNRRIIAVILGIDNFRNVNELIGHEGGNQILKEIAQRLRLTIGDCADIARVSGDEFLIILGEKYQLEEIALRVENIMNVIRNVYNYKGREIYITACAGISFYPEDSNNAEELMKYASSALAHAKEMGQGSYRFYDAEMNKNTEKRIYMMLELRNAISKNELQLYYQAQIDLNEKKYIGVEALSRWNSAVFGNVPPSVFIPLAEEMGIIEEIGEWVLETACKQMYEWHEMGLDQLYVAVNISPKQFDDENFVEKFKKIISESKINPVYLELEVTEGLFINDINNAIAKLNKLREVGVKIAVDDFGTGYSSLSYIKRLPIDKLKIDRTFIKDIPDSDEGAIANTIINLAKNLSLCVIAEGVETVEQEQFLKEKLCNGIQGYLYCVPLPANKILEKIKDVYL